MNAHTDLSVPRDPGRTKKPMERRAALASMVGSVVEWYDFYLYGTVTALVFNKIFFTNLSPTASVVAAFGTYAVGFVARPVGAIIAGPMADRHGRRLVLIVSLIAMGVTTTLIGALPTYHQIGLLAPVLLVTLRLIQGLAVGGEQGSAAVFSVEHSADHRRGLWGSLVNSGAAMGLLIASGSFALVNHLLSTPDLLAWGWRIPFLASPLLIVVGLVIRATVPESPLLDAGPATKGNRNSIRELVDSSRRNLVLGIALRVSQTTASYFYTTFSIYYVATTVGKHSSAALIGVSVSSAITLLSAPMWGSFSDRKGHRQLYLFGSLGSAAYIIVFFLLVDTHSTILIVFSIVLGLNVFHDAMSGHQPAWLSEMFPTAVRASGVAISYQVGAVLGGGMLPLVAAGLLALGGGRPWLIVLYFAVLTIPTALAAYLAPETKRRTLATVTG